MFTYYEFKKKESLLKEYSTGTTTAGETAETMKLLLEDTIF